MRSHSEKLHLSPFAKEISSGEMSDEVTKKSDNFSSYKLLEVTLHSYTFTFRRLNEKFQKL